MTAVETSPTTQVPRTTQGPFLTRGATVAPAMRTTENLLPQPRQPLEAMPAVTLGDSARTRWIRSYARAIAAADAGIALVASWVALAAASPQPQSAWIVCLLLVPFGWVGALTLSRSYEPRFLVDGDDGYRLLIDVGVRLMAVTGVLALVTGLDLARTYTLIAFPVLLVGGLVARYAGRRVEARARRRGVTMNRALVVGTERAVAEMLRRLAGRDDHAFEFVGALVDRCRQSEIEGVPVVGVSSDVRWALDAHQADTVIVAAWSTFSQEELRHLSWELEESHVDVLVTPNLTDVAGTRISVRPVVGLPLLHVGRPEFNGLRRIGKNMFDFVAAALGLLVVGPLILLLAVAVRLDSRGPAFYRQHRVGRGGSQFPMLKLRTMQVGADQMIADLTDANTHDAGPLFKIKQDPRVTRVGSFLRRTSLDELPQLWNVLKGQMSLVGPRPPLPTEVAQYGDDVHRRLLVKPGITGLWQVSGRSDLDWEESVRLDLYYVENWSFLLDVSIISRTFRAVIAARGAY